MLSAFPNFARAVNNSKSRQTQCGKKRYTPSKALSQFLIKIMTTPADTQQQRLQREFDLCCCQNRATEPIKHSLVRECEMVMCGVAAFSGVRRG
jgi:hypothetical protein